ncbi:MAG: hypothetical protein GXO76_11405 [Calditrichaeota bacterium]|nr:hypothetical protein [Calditrichota bacterium]
MPAAFWGGAPVKGAVTQGKHGKWRGDISIKQNFLNKFKIMYFVLDFGNKIFILEAKSIGF